MKLRNDRGETGAVALLFAAGAVFLFVLAAIVVDLGLARDTKRESQNAADAAALAAANRLYLNSSTPDLAAATAAAKAYALSNFKVAASEWNAGNCTDPGHLAVLATGTECISFDNATNPTRVRVRVPIRDVNTGLGALADVSTVEVEALAEAGVSASTNFNCSLCFLGSIDMRNSDFTVTGGGIQVNGNVDAGPNSFWNAGSIGVSGSVNGGNFTPTVADAPTFTDPLAGLVLPTHTGTPNPAALSRCNTTLTPGIYTNVTLRNNDVCTLNPGKYVITGRWLLGNNSVLQGTGVTLYFTCGTVASPRTCLATDTSGGWLDGKNGTVAISSGATGFTDYAIIYVRNNPQDLGLQGNGGTSITGGVYAAKARLDFNGNSQFGFRGGPVVVLGVLFANGNQSGITVTDATDITAATQPGAIALSK